jgi:hypothetical protein
MPAKLAMGPNRKSMLLPRGIKPLGEKLMDESIDYTAVIQQLQLENERLRGHMRLFSEARDAVYSVPELIQELWQKLISNKMSMLAGVMIVYWCVAIVLMIYDRFPK